MSALPIPVAAVPLPTSGPAVSSGAIKFSIGDSPKDPNAIIFGEQNTPTSVSPLELPARLNDLGGMQKHAVHLFPGGYKTLQALGAFPDPLTWTGVFLGGNAFARHFQMDAKRRNGKAAYLTYGPWQWVGLLTQFQTEAKHQNYCAYRATFEPSQDLTASGQATAPSASQAANSMTQNIAQIDQEVAAQSALSAASLAALRAYILVAQALIIAYGEGQTLGASQTLQLTAATVAANAALAIDAASGVPSAMSAASAMAAYVGAISGSLTTTAVATTIRVVNPNLVQLASQYLGDATRWQDIANLNGLNDMEPSGSYTLSIPGA